MIYHQQDVHNIPQIPIIKYRYDLLRNKVFRLIRFVVSKLLKKKVNFSIIACWKSYFPVFQQLLTIWQPDNCVLHLCCYRNPPWFCIFLEFLVAKSLIYCFLNPCLPPPFFLLINVPSHIFDMPPEVAQHNTRKWWLNLIKLRWNSLVTFINNSSYMCTIWIVIIHTPQNCIIFTQTRPHIHILHCKVLNQYDCGYNTDHSSQLSSANLLDNWTHPSKLLPDMVNNREVFVEKYI